MRLYHSPLSSNARRTVMTAIQLGTDVELVQVDLAKGEQRRPDFLAKNPNGKVPVLDDDGFVIWESHAIMQYLADRTPGQTIYPTELRARTDVNRWLFWSAHQLSPSVAILNWERMVKKLIGLGEPEPALVAKGEAQVGECLRVLDGHLAGKEWLAQGKLTLADLAVSTPLMSIGPAQLPVAGHDHVLRWFEQVKQLDAWKKTSL
jgi:glutathione S-transferase